MKERFPKGNRQPGEILLEVNDLHAEDPNKGKEVLRGVSLTFVKARSSVLRG